MRIAAAPRYSTPRPAQALPAQGQRFSGVSAEKIVRPLAWAGLMGTGALWLGMLASAYNTYAHAKPVYAANWTAFEKLTHELRLGYKAVEQAPDPESAARYEQWLDEKLAWNLNRYMGDLTTRLAHDPNAKYRELGQILKGQEENVLNFLLSEPTDARERLALEQHKERLVQSVLKADVPRDLTVLVDQYEALLKNNTDEQETVATVLPEVLDAASITGDLKDASGPLAETTIAVAAFLLLLNWIPAKRPLLPGEDPA